MAKHTNTIEAIKVEGLWHVIIQAKNGQIIHDTRLHRQDGYHTRSGAMYHIEKLRDMFQSEDYEVTLQRTIRKNRSKWLKFFKGIEIGKAKYMSKNNIDSLRTVLHRYGMSKHMRQEKSSTNRYRLRRVK